LYYPGTTVTLVEPTRDNYTFIGWTFDGNEASHTGNTITIGNSETTVTANWLESSLAITNFTYTGTEQTFTAPVSGYYKLEVWGAQGGAATGGSNGGTISFTPGYGGYSVGSTFLNKGEELFIYVGGKGTNNCVSSNNGSVVTCAGGYNGGGTGYSSDTYRYTSGGGGATHIAKVSGLLETLSANKSSILIVAGGGGGSGYYNYSSAGLKGTGGSGGGYSGASGKASTNSSLSAAGGTISSGNSFGKGQTPSTSTSNAARAGGGGGYYGGLSGGANSIGAGGGSGYISNSLLVSTHNIEKQMYCYGCDVVTMPTIKTTSTSSVSSTATSNYAKSGDGYAKISYDSPYNLIDEIIPKNGNYVNIAYSGVGTSFSAPSTGYYKLEVWGAQGGIVTGGTNGGTTSFTPAYGGYSVGTVYLEKNEIIYAYVGGKGTDNCITSNNGTVVTCSGGYNGGGTGYTSDKYRYTSGGGGATHISKTNTTLDKFSLNDPNLLIVAGGGGGQGYYNYSDANLKGSGGSGGGISGVNGTSSTSSDVAAGGTQTTGSAIGKGETPSTSTSNASRAGGGGGYYGGKSGSINSIGAGGGSGYIGNPLLLSYSTITKSMYCYNCTTSTAEGAKTVSTTNYSSTPTSNYAKSGNGHAKITYIGE